MKTERGAYAAGYELFVDAVNAEKLIVMAVDVTDAEEKRQQEGQEEGEEQVVAASPTVPYLAVL